MLTLLFLWMMLWLDDAFVCISKVRKIDQKNKSATFSHCDTRILCEDFDPIGCSKNKQTIHTHTQNIQHVKDMDQLLIRCTARVYPKEWSWPYCNHISPEAVQCTGILKLLRELTFIIFTTTLNLCFVEMIETVVAPLLQFSGCYTELLC